MSDVGITLEVLESYSIMANPITPVGTSDIFDSARQQDAERRAREVVDHIARTGEAPRFYQEYSPLVEDDIRPDIASDGDSYNDLGSQTIRDRIDNMFDMEPSESRRTRMEAVRQEENQKEQAIELRRQKEKEEIEILRAAAKKRFNNAVSGLSLND